MISQRLCLSLRALRERLAFHAKNARSCAKSQRNTRKLRHYPEILTRGNTLVFTGIVSNTAQLQENCTFRGPGARRFGVAVLLFVILCMPLEQEPLILRMHDVHYCAVRSNCLGSSVL